MLIKYLNVLAVGNTREEYCLCIVQVNLLFLMAIGIALVGMISIQADVFGMIDMFPRQWFCNNVGWSCQHYIPLVGKERS